MLFILLMVAVTGHVTADPFATAFSDKPEHAILLIIDGLSYKVWDRLNLPVLTKMIQGGALVEKNYLTPAAHPHSGAYAELHSGSIPNPILLSGTVFITRETTYLQDSFYPSKTAAFIANTLAYNSLNRNYHYSYQQDGRDADAIRVALKFMEMGKPAFMHIHLQDTGGAGGRSLSAPENVPWRWNIWAEGSPYRAVAQRADSLVGEFVTGLEKLGVLDKTVIVVMGDHGQSDSGWHPLESMDASITTIVLWGAGVKKNVRIPYSEQIDVTPTICALMGVSPPKTSQGRVIAETLTHVSGSPSPRKMLMREMLDLFTEYRKKIAIARYEIEKLSPEKQGNIFTRFDRAADSFYDISRFTEWSRFHSLEELLEANKKAMEALNGMLGEIEKTK